MSLVFLLLVADAIVVVVVVVRLLPLFIMMTISTIQRFVFYMPLLAVGVMTHSYFLGPTYYRNNM
jgi:hypothetical protein